MSNHQQKSKNDPSEPTDLRELMIEIEKRYLKLASIQTVLSVAAVFTGVIALYAALTESHAVRKQTNASVWPYVQSVISDNASGDSAHFRITFSNVGVGPAKMQGVAIHYQGEVVTNWESFISQLDSQAELGVTYGKSDVQDRVMAPKESLVIFQMHKLSLVKTLQSAVAQGELGLSYCYCSIFEDCWLQPLKDIEGQLGVESVESCAGYSKYSSL